MPSRVAGVGQAKERGLVTHEKIDTLCNASSLQTGQQTYRQRCRLRQEQLNLSSQDHGLGLHAMVANILFNIFACQIML